MVNIGWMSAENEAVLLLHWQTPDVQVSPPPQIWLQPPQFKGSLDVFTHVLPQSVPPLGQTHFPLLQTRPPEHTVPQPPQLLGSEVTSMHVPPQLVVPVGH